MKIYQISDVQIDLAAIENIAGGELKLQLSSGAVGKINNCRNYLDEKIKSSSTPIYGVTTGFGSLYNQTIAAGDQGLLQNKLVQSHACGTGDEVPAKVMKLMLFLKIQALSYGFSGISIKTVNRLIDFYNHDILPVIYQQGSLGASGDLAPLAHLALPLLGLGEVYFKGEKMASSKIVELMNWDTIQLQSKEGLALLNGTQFMSAYGIICLLRALKLLKQAEWIAAMSLDAFNGSLEPFDDLIQQVRPFKGQVDTAASIRALLAGSELINSRSKELQDPYSFRCIPQVHGASKDALDHVLQVFLTEINSVTDNPTIFPEHARIISGGNFHGQPLALSLDYLCIALAELGSISERRIFKLLSGFRGLPPYLIANPGLNSGFMIVQYTAASIVSQNKQLCTPASVDTIDSSNSQEDHVSMGANAAVKAYQVVTNLERILAIELFTAAQALEFRRPMRSSPIIEKWLAGYRQKVPFLEEDKVMHNFIEASIRFLQESGMPE